MPPISSVSKTPGPSVDQREVTEAKPVKGTPAGKLQKTLTASLHRPV